jgi:O-Antigen ligase
VGLVFITNSGFADHAFLPTVSFMGGNLFLSDGFVLAGAAIVLVIESGRGQRLLPEYGWQTAVLCLTIACSVLVGQFNGADLHYTLRELHCLVYYPLAFFLAVRAFRRPEAIPRFLIASAVILAISCIATIWQLLLLSRFQFMTHAGAAFGLALDETLDAKSIRPPSQWLFLVFILMAVSTYHLWRRHRRAIIVLMVLDIFCIFIGYSRTIFVAIAGGLLALGVTRSANAGAFIKKVSKGGVIALLILVMLRFVISEIAPGYWSAFEERVVSSFTASALDSDEPWVVGSRLYETEMAINHIENHPILGIGIGTPYRDILLFEYTQAEVAENPDDGRHFIHNTYLYILMKCGIPGVLAVGWAVWTMLRRNWLLTRNVTIRSGIPQGLLASFVGLGIANLVAPGFIATPATPVLVGIMAALIEVSIPAATRAQRKRLPQAVVAGQWAQSRAEGMAGI